MSRNGASSISRSAGDRPLLPLVADSRPPRRRRTRRRPPSCRRSRACARSAPRASSQHARQRRGSCRPRAVGAASRVGVEHGHVRQRDVRLDGKSGFSVSSVRLSSAETIERRLNCSGTTTVTNCDSPCGSAHRYSITASTRPSSARQHLEVRPHVRQVAEARTQSRIGAAARCAMARKPSPAVAPRVPQRLTQSGIDRVDEEDDLVRRRRRRRNGAHACAQPTADAP